MAAGAFGEGMGGLLMRRAKFVYPIRCDEKYDHYILIIIKLMTTFSRRDRGPGRNAREFAAA